MNHLTKVVAMGRPPLFEIPNIPLSVSRLRIKEAFEGGLCDKAVRYLSQKWVLAVRHSEKVNFEFDVGRVPAGPQWLETPQVLCRGCHRR